MHGIQIGLRGVGFQAWGGGSKFSCGSGLAVCRYYVRMMIVGSVWG